MKVTVEQMPDSKMEAPTDAVVGITTTNIRGSDLHNIVTRFDRTRCGTNG